MEDNPVILIVDDEPTNIDIISNIIKDNYKVKFSLNGKEAFDIIKESVPDIILLDIYMPEMNGTELLEILKEIPEYKNIPIIIISSIDDIETIASCIKKGADNYLLKPFEPIILNARINSSLEKKRLYDKEIMLKNKLSKHIEELKKSHKDKEMFTNMLVHDIRNPLTIIASYIDFLKILIENDNIEKEKFIRRMKLMNNSVYQIESLIQEILYINKMENNEISLNLENIEINCFLNEIIEQFKLSKDNKNVKLNNSDQDKIFVKGDKNILVRILQNLIGNALKHTKEDTDVTISCNVDNNKVCMSIKDRGDGIPKEFHNKIFDKYFQLDNLANRKKYGAGLGLAFCKLATEIHNGHIELKSEIGKGSEFIVKLPLHNKI